ncbi:hypothetical protein AAF712_011361 [Marasmius tenuissimus]|uniref:Glycosyltransferase 61 catalytic domain-containing protein n=1 Tax=Marasmius tenuissimus TaxID=585030 RepID=A0ABR2ZM17_9AGAR
MALSFFHGGRRRPGRIVLLLGLFFIGVFIAELLGDYSQSNVKQVLLKQIKAYQSGDNKAHDHDGRCRIDNQTPGMEHTCDIEDDDLSDKDRSSQPGAQGSNEGLGSVLNPTAIPGGAITHGFTVFDDLYLRDGTLYVVTKDRKSFPRLPEILAKPLKMEPGVSLVPTSDELQFIKPERARGRFGDHIHRFDGFTVLVYDPSQFMHHYYHWWGEIILGLWRVYSKLGVREGDTVTPLPFPKRFLAPFVEETGWRDRASMNGPLMRATFPGVAVETGHYWQDLIELDMTYVFSRVLVVNREAAHKHPFSSQWFKMIAGTMNVTALEGFWDPIRRSLLTNLLGYKPQFSGPGIVVSPLKVASSAPVVTYISRQRTGRRLKQEDHEALVEELMTLGAQGFCEVNVVQMEDMSLKDQVELAARTTIMIGVHGNGLTHQLWMTPSLTSTVVELLVPGGYTYDFELLARNMGHKHYAVWNDTYVTYPKGTTHKGIKYPPGFHGSQIPVWPETVANIIRQRLSGAEVGVYASFLLHEGVS